MDNDNKNLLALEKWYDLFKDKEKRKLDEEAYFLDDVLKELQTEFGMYTDIKMPKEDEIDEESIDEDKNYIPVDKPEDLGIYIFGYNLSELPNSAKLFYGFGFLSLVMGIIYYLFYYMRKNNNVNSRNKKRRY